MILGVSVAVLVVDLSIKAAILEESTKLRLAIEGERNDRATEANASRTSDNDSDSSGLLGLHATGMEATDVRQNGGRKAPATGTRRSRQTRPKPGAYNPEVSPGI
jgi:hypothetical protein